MTDTGHLLRAIRAEVVEDLIERIDEIDGSQVSDRALALWLHTPGQIKEWLQDIHTELTEER